MASIFNRPPPKVQRFNFGPWHLTCTESHILPSEGNERVKFESELGLPNVPEMIFADNSLRLQHELGFGIQFTALEALKRVNNKLDPMQVAVAKEWQEARAHDEHIKNLARPYDWTYSTDYNGTLFGDNATFQVLETDEKVDLEKLKKKEKIMFYSDLLLYEDELSDHGSAVLNVKVRVMPTSLFILQRFYLRVDEVLVRVNDTRLFHEAEWDYILREYTNRESPISELTIEDSIILDRNEIWQHLPVMKQHSEKLCLPSQTCQPAT